MRLDSSLAMAGARLRSRKKALAVHGAILTAFVSFLLFGSDAVFERLARVDGESRRVTVSLPAESKGMAWAIDHLLVMSKVIEVEGWAFMEGQDAQQSRICVVLRSGTGTYVFNTFQRSRPDVAVTFEGHGRGLDHSGFVALLPRDEIPGDGGQIPQNGYALGIYIKGNEAEAFEYTDRVLGVVSRAQQIPLPADGGRLSYEVDRCSPGPEATELEGWAFIEDGDARNSRTYVVLRSDANTYVFDTFWRRRTDVSSGFAGHGRNLAESGFIAFIPPQVIAAGGYRVGIYVKDGDEEALRYSNEQFCR
jgi:hypothetical protein